MSGLGNRYKVYSLSFSGSLAKPNWVFKVINCHGESNKEKNALTQWHMIEYQLFDWTIGNFFWTFSVWNWNVLCYNKNTWQRREQFLSPLPCLLFPSLLVCMEKRWRRVVQFKFLYWKSSWLKINCGSRNILLKSQ